MNSDSSDYDASGNLTKFWDFRGFTSPVTGTTIQAQTITRYYYSPDERLRVLDKRAIDSVSLVGLKAPDNVLNTFEEYRYDALGRRVLRRAQRPICEAYCHSTIERFVWDGDFLAHEIRYPGRPLTLDSLEVDTGYVMKLVSPCPPLTPCYDTTYTPHYGTVTYGYDGTIDKPLTIYRNWYARDSSTFGTVSLLPNYDQRGSAVGNLINTGIFNPASEVVWPAADVRTYGFWASAGAPKSWFGSLIPNSQEASGLQYKRNRYYNAAAGRFTQEDPIGLAGGMNLYGFAGGDPVNYSDPFGLRPDTLDVSPAAQPMVDKCAAQSATCKRELEMLDQSTDQWRIETGKPGSCSPYIVGCTSHNQGGGGTIRIVPGEFKLGADLVKLPVNSSIVIGHEAGHALTDLIPACAAQGERCAIQHENVVRTDLGMKALRPVPGVP